jgi:hypothetical protein
LFFSAGVVFHCVLCFCFVLFSEVFLVMGHFLFNIVYFIFNSFISLFIVFSVSRWCLFRAPMI